MGLTQWEKFVVERIPVPIISHDSQQSFIRLVDHISQTKDSNTSADVRAQEKEIDHLAYSLYGLSPSEIAAMEEALNERRRIKRKFFKN